MGREQSVLKIRKIDRIEDANATVGVSFDGNSGATSRKIYHYGIRVEDTDLLNYTKEYVYLEVLGSGIHRGAAVTIETFFPIVLKDATRTLDVMHYINFCYDEFYEEKGYGGKVCVMTVETELENNNGITTSQPKTKMEKDDEMMKTTNNVFKDAGKQISGVFGMSMLNSEPVIQIGGKFLSFDKSNRTITEAMEELVIKLDFMPGILMPVLVSQLRPGDVVSIEGGLALVKNLTQTGATVRIIDSSGTENDFTPIVNGMFGVAYVLKLMNPMEGMMGQGQQAGFNPMMLMAMGSGDSGDMDMGKAMMMSMMMGGMQQQPPVASAGVHQSPWMMPMPMPGETPTGWKVDQNKGDL